VLHTFPENIAKSIAEGQVLQLVVFSVLFAIALLMVGDTYRRPMLNFAHSLSEVMFKFTGIIMYFAPFGVAGAIASTVANPNLGLSVFINLGKLLGTLYIALFVFVVCVLLPIALYMRIPLRRFWKYASEPVSIAFATSSSEAALPAALSAMKRYGISSKVVSFVIPTGMSFNLDGTTLYLALAGIFVAQAAGVPMTLGQQILMLFTLMLTSKGVAGVSRASLVILLATAASFNLPEWPIAAIMGIDALMDMARTSVNMLGNCLATAVVAKWEGEEIPEFDAEETAA
jgi:proton glutamate symport protein